MHLASTAVCRNQAFAFGEHTLALQFHAETAGRALEAWFVGHTCEIAATPGQSVAALRAATLLHSALLIERGSACFREWLAAQAALKAAPLLEALRSRQSSELSTRPQFASRPCATVT